MFRQRVKKFRERIKLNFQKKKYSLIFRKRVKFYFRKRIWQDDAQFCSQAGQNGFSGERKVLIEFMHRHTRQQTLYPQKRLTFQESFRLEPFVEMLEQKPGPTEVLGKICDHFLGKKVIFCHKMEIYLNQGWKFMKRNVVNSWGRS